MKRGAEHRLWEEVKRTKKCARTIILDRLNGLLNRLISITGKVREDNIVSIVIDFIEKLPQNSAWMREYADEFVLPDMYKLTDELVEFLDCAFFDANREKDRREADAYKDSQMMSLTIAGKNALAVIKTAEEKMKELARDNYELAQEKISLVKENQELRGENQDLAATIEASENWKKRCVRLDDEISKACEEIDDLRTENQNLARAIERASEPDPDQEQEFEFVKALVKDQQKQIDQLLLTIGKQEDEKLNAQSLIDDLLKKVEDQEYCYDKLEGANNKLNDLLEKSTTALNSTTIELSSYALQVGQLQKALEEKTTQISSLEKTVHLSEDRRKELIEGIKTAIKSKDDAITYYKDVKFADDKLIAAQATKIRDLSTNILALRRELSRAAEE